MSTKEVVMTEEWNESDDFKRVGTEGLSGEDIGEKSLTYWADVWRRFRENKLAIFGLILLGLIVVLLFIGPMVTGQDYQLIDASIKNQGPSSAHWFGTDDMGRDLFTRVCVGGRISIYIGLCCTLVMFVIGALLGALAGLKGGLVDDIIMRICDVLLAFPGLILAIAIVAILGSGLYNVVIAVAVFNIPKFARLVRGNTLETKNSVFVQAARNIGAGDMRILFKHILPSAIPNIIVQYTMSIGTSIITASSLSFLGMGAQPPTPEWGLLLSNGRNYMLTSWHITLFPGLAIFFTVLCFNLLGDGLRDALDPKLTD